MGVDRNRRRSSGRMTATTSSGGRLAAVLLAMFLVPLPGVAHAAATLSWSAPIAVDHQGGRQGRLLILNSIACPTASQCTAVDKAGQEVTFNPASPGSPIPITIDSGNHPTSVACPSISQCTAVDKSG